MLFSDEEMIESAGVEDAEDFYFRDIDPATGILPNIMKYESLTILLAIPSC